MNVMIYRIRTLEPCLVHLNDMYTLGIVFLWGGSLVIPTRLLNRRPEMLRASFFSGRHQGRAIGKSRQSRQYKLKLKFEKTKCHLGGGILAQTTLRFSVVKGPIARLCFVPVLAQQFGPPGRPRAPRRGRPRPAAGSSPAPLPGPARARP